MLYNVFQEDWIACLQDQFDFRTLHTKGIHMLSDDDSRLISAALDQGSWFLNQTPKKDWAASRPLEIVDHRLEGSAMSLTIKFGDNDEATQYVDVLYADLGGRFGVAFAEQQVEQEFFLACGIPYATREHVEAGSAGAHWQKNNRGDIGLVFVRSADAPPGWPMPSNMTPYGYAEHIACYGSGKNLLRTERVAQPRALKPGDMLATGARVLSPPRRGFNDRILVHVTRRGAGEKWVPIAAELPIALLVKGDAVPPEIWTLK